MPFFSVIIPLYNKENFIKATLKTVLNQTFQDFEIIIVNDGSTDKSFKIVNTFNDERIETIDQENRGLSASRNIGIKASAGQFVAFLDADDLWAEDYLFTVHKIINTHIKKSVFATNLIPFFSIEKINLANKPYNPKSVQIIFNYFKISKSIIGPSSLVVKKEVFDKVGNFDETINYGEENDFYIRCFMEYDLIYYQEPKAYYRTGIANQLTSPDKNFKRTIPNYEAYLKNYKHKDLKKFLDFVHYNLIVLFKMEKNYKLVDYYKNKTNAANLTILQKIKYYLPTNLFYSLKKIYIWFSKILSHS